MFIAVTFVGLVLISSLRLMGFLLFMYIVLVYCSYCSLSFLIVLIAAFVSGVYYSLLLFTCLLFIVVLQCC